MFPEKILTRNRLLVLSMFLFLMVLSFANAPASPAAVQEPVKVLVNGQEVYFPDAGPFMDEKGHVQVPARFVAQELGARVTWEGETATASISGSGKSIALVAGQDSATVNGEAVQLDSGAVLVEDRIFVPARFIVETLGATVQWDENAKTVMIASVLPIIKNSGISDNKGEPAQKQEEYIIFTPVPEDALNSEQKAFIEEARKTKGIHNKGDLYVIALGAQPNPGYGLEIVKTRMIWEQARVYIKLTKPETGKMYAAVISYPFLVGKVKLPPYTTISFIVEETGERL